MISLSYAHSLSLSTTFIFVSLIMLSAVYTNFNLNKVEISGVRLIDGEEGEAGCLLQIHNDSSRTKFDIEVKIGKFSSENSITVERGKTQKIFVPFSKLERGVYHVKKITLRTEFPFGIFYSWKLKQAGEKVFIYPKAVNHGIAAKEEANLVREGKSSTTKAGGDDFVGHKSYLDGDSWRQIDWKAWARERGLLSKTFEENLALDQVLNYSLLSLPEEKKMEQLANWIRLAQDEGSRFKLILPGKMIEFGHGESHARLCLRALAEYGKQEVVL